MLRSLFRAKRAGGPVGLCNSLMATPPLAFDHDGKCRSRRRRMRGFTLIELMITVAIVGLLASVALPLAEMSVKRGKEADLRIALREVRQAIDAYKRAGDEGLIAKPAEKSGYPPALKVLVEGVENQRDPKDGRVYFLRRVPVDPMTGKREWGVRSYASPPDQPQKGDDVFDVYSLSEDTGLNGIRYKDW